MVISHALLEESFSELYKLSCFVQTSRRLIMKRKNRLWKMSRLKNYFDELIRFFFHMNRNYCSGGKKLSLETLNSFELRSIFFHLYLRWQSPCAKFVWRKRAWSPKLLTSRLRERRSFVATQCTLVPIHSIHFHLRFTVHPFCSLISHVSGPSIVCHLLYPFSHPHREYSQARILLRMELETLPLATPQNSLVIYWLIEQNAQKPGSPHIQITNNYCGYEYLFIFTDVLYILIGVPMTDQVWHKVQHFRHALQKKT